MHHHTSYNHPNSTGVKGMSWQSELDELRARETLARQMGGADKVERQHRGGRLTVRERITALVDAESFHEVGAIAGQASYDAAGNLVQATTTEVALGVRDRVIYDNAPGVTPGTDYGHLLGVDFGHIDAQLGRHGGTAMTPDINRPLGQIDAAWYNAERAAVTRALQLQEAGTPFRVVAEARGHDANGVAAATRLRIEVNGVPNFDSGWIGNPASANFQRPEASDFALCPARWGGIYVVTFEFL